MNRRIYYDGALINKIGIDRIVIKKVVLKEINAEKLDTALTCCAIHYDKVIVEGRQAIKALVEKYNTEGTFNPQNIVLFGYSFNYVEMENLKTNVKILRDSEKNLKINLDVRY